ncbi:hypothetical protein DYB36_008551 [Aphanomyces astaci]|uniref:ABC transporter domain-containing protein n=1 Tax=Aphanomyces astaci TaxID=112090 RepID=A0A397A2U8_APHAT|nr:hypothetical protein DYB36_008551 [Aphanomyces astaci]
MEAATPHGYTRTLLWKNVRLKRKHPIKTLFEVVLPIALLALLGYLKSQMADTNRGTGWATWYGPSDPLYRGSSPNTNYVQAEATMTGLLLDLGSNRNGYGSDPIVSTTCRKASLAGHISTNPTSPYAWPSLCQSVGLPKKIAIVPDNTFTRQYFAEAVSQWYPRLELTSNIAVPSFADSVVFFPNEQALEDSITEGRYGVTLDSPPLAAAIVFTAMPSTLGTPGNIEYSLRFNTTTGGNGGVVPRTSGDVVDLLQRGLDPNAYKSYAREGFYTLQTLVTRFATCVPDWKDGKTTGTCTMPNAVAAATPQVDAMLLQQVFNDTRLAYTFSAASNGKTYYSPRTFTSNISKSAYEPLIKPLRLLPQATGGGLVFPFPVMGFTVSPFFEAVDFIFGIVFVLSYIQCLSAILVALISEKETKTRELLKILGVPDVAIVGSWYITYGVVLFVASLVQAGVASAVLFNHSSVVLLFLFFWLFSCSLLAYSYMVSAIFSKAKVGAYLGVIGFLLMYVVSTAFTNESTAASKVLASLLSPVALVFGVNNLAASETNGVGITFDNVNESIKSYKFSTALVLLLVDSVVYTVLGLYLERVVPKDYGVTEVWYFPVSPSYWRRSSKPPSRHDGVQGGGGAVVLNVDANSSAIEAVGMELKQQEVTGDALQIRNLRKVFPGPDGGKVAVKGLDLTMYKNQITCLLGHNGAGKTTLISMLTGMISISGGDATVNGLSLTHDMAVIRRSMGICPQHDVLYAELTVEEHLVLYSKIKGFSGQAMLDQVDASIAEVGLTEKRHARSSDLSGGMKRKLSLAIALLGDSQIVFLDEPTSGMDPYSRRSSWEIIMNNRQNRIVVLTTHFMDEADILGDRIAIMAEGDLRCCGSSLFLKNRYGAGYNFSLVKTDACDTNVLLAFVNNHVHGRANVLSNVGTEIAFQLPLDCAPLFGGMFADLDHHMTQLGVVSYGISVTTMEEVFIKVAELGDENQQHTLVHKTPKDLNTNISGNKLPAIPPSALAMFGMQFVALFKKRFRTAKRDKRAVIFGAVLPVVLLIAGIALLKSTFVGKNDPALVMSTKRGYPLGDQTPVPFTCQSDWMCDATTLLSDAKAYDLQLTAPVYPSSSPTIFNVTYSNLSVSGVSGFNVRAGEDIWKRGFGIDNTPIVRGQYGGYVIFGSKTDRLFGYNVAVNTTGPHASVLHKALLDEALYRKVTGNNDLTLRLTSKPLPLTNYSKVKLSTLLSFMAPIFVLLAFSLYTASVVPYLVKERDPTANAKHQQLVSGVGVPAFWLANLAWDLVVYAVPCATGLVAIYLFDITPYTGVDCKTCATSPFPAIVLSFVLLGFALVSFCYVLSFVLKSAASSQTYAILLNVLLGMILLIVSAMLNLLNAQTKALNATLLFVWRLSPLFCVGNGLYTLSLVTLESTDEAGPKSAFSTDVMGYELLYLAVEAVVFPLLAMGVDHILSYPKLKAKLSRDPKGIREAPSDEETDFDVAAEERRVDSGAASQQDAVVMNQLRKVYKDGKVGVASVSLGLPKGECFGYLGINGAGKTTTMKMLTGDLVASSGSATLGGFDILAQQLDVRRLIGYCPQFDALIDLLSVREHLELYAAIKGISAINDTVATLMSQMNLDDFEHKLAGTLSGGNKRKLSVAIAMIGSPPIIFLDEPSTGMDPVSRRFMWDVIADMSTRSKESTILLTTHSMEECEALCTRVGIMVGGALRCLGSVQHLKHRFGDGLSMHVKTSHTTSAVVDQMVLAHFGTSTATISVDELAQTCNLLGNESRAALVTDSHATGYVLAEALDRDDSVSVRDFCAWWIAEDKFDKLAAYLSSKFDAANVLERQNDVCRFRLLGSQQSLALSRVFSVVESAKTELSIQDYTVSQTTLEQIFNGFAAKQTQETGVARGLDVKKKRKAKKQPKSKEHDNYQAHRA